MFNDSTQKCNYDISETEVMFSKLDTKPMKMAFCQFQSVPAWGLVIGALTKHLEVPHVVSLENPVVTHTIRGITPHQAALNEPKDFSDPDKPFGNFTILNTGLHRLAFKVENSNFSFFKVFPMTSDEKYIPARLGTTALEERIWGRRVLMFNFDVEEIGKLSPGTHVGYVHIVPNAWVSGCKFDGEIRATVELTVVDDSMASWFLTYYNQIVATGFLIAFAFCLKVVRKAMRNHFKGEAAKLEHIDTALNVLASVAHPMVVIEWATFKRLGRIISHEEGQAGKDLTSTQQSSSLPYKTKWLYTVQEISDFSKDNNLVFMSHQWTSYRHPDPSGDQYRAMVNGVEAVVAKRGWDESRLYLWVDYISIPQKHRGLQTLAINSLPVYAARVAAFVIVAPPVQHEENDTLCDKNSYQRRAWCRAEQMSHLLAVGWDNMYLAEGTELSELTQEWLDQSFEVFQGELTCCARKHVGMDRCDREYLVVPMLGLWSELCQSCAEPRFADIHQRLSSRIDEAFPSHFDYITPTGVERKMLFGDLLYSLYERMEEKRVGEKHKAFFNRLL